MRYSVPVNVGISIIDVFSSLNFEPENEKHELELMTDSHYQHHTPSSPPIYSLFSLLGEYLISLLCGKKLMH